MLLYVQINRCVTKSKWRSPSIPTYTSMIQEIPALIRDRFALSCTMAYILLSLPLLICSAACNELAV
jgi:hypothetical protein